MAAIDNLISLDEQEKPVAWMSEAKCGAILGGTDPGYRFAHPGYDTISR
jgi:hypothetical protein